jgi:hypothetical protein
MLVKYTYLGLVIPTLIAEASFTKVTLSCKNGKKTNMFAKSVIPGLRDNK